jgi:hypothetical protein
MCLQGFSGPAAVSVQLLLYAAVVGGALSYVRAERVSWEAAAFPPGLFLGDQHVGGDCRLPHCIQHVVGVLCKGWHQAVPAANWQGVVHKQGGLAHLLSFRDNPAGQSALVFVNNMNLPQGRG